MAFSVQMPALGESVTEGTVTRWLKQEGDHVEVDEPLLEISTDKVDTEIPSPAAGVLQRIVVGEDQTVEVGAELALIGDGSGGGQTPSEPPAQPAPEPARQAAQPESGGSGRSGGSAGSGGGMSVTMPALGESVTEGTVTRWLKHVGDTVEVDEPLLEVSTDKVDTEIPSPVTGTVLEITAGEDETVEVGGHLAVIGRGAPAPAASRPAPRPASEPRAEPTTAAPAPPPAREAPRSALQPVMTTSDGAPYVTPLVRKLAAEHGVDLSEVTGTGVGGRIRKQDVLAVAERAAAPAVPQEAPEKAPEKTPEKAPEKAPERIEEQPPAAVSTEPSPATSRLRGTTEKMSRLRTLIAERMVESLQVSAQLTTVVEADVTRIARLRERAKRDFEAREGVRLSFLPFFARTVVEALKQHPKLNASIDTDSKQITYHGSEHLGVAVDTDRGLLVPVIHDAGDLNIAGLARRIDDLAQRTRTSKVTPDELGGGTFTLSNTGSRGALFDTPIIMQPQVGILGAGTVVKRPVIVADEMGEDAIAIRSMVYLALSYDHRLVDGADAARFLATVKQRLEAGAFQADLGL